ncbi:pentapeptide repeat-containing protein [Argonema antarcticum]|uniref:pentapeptide repeat-containing protein n=1 Tax=Argonema antarcticum TaxID=2942763 RepID=UPI0020125F73|nr:pentapeptide repeat-containing protein [Argonema antarcticum]MCL1470764.1 pentapeptide repeat-containing protein [Argonema antarcticum A004/B2]
MQKKSSNSSQISWQKRSHKLPLGVRRCGAWVVEVSLIVAAGVVPFSIGLYAESQRTSEPVPLNPLLVTTQDAIAQTLALPIYQKNRQVTPATNFLWSAALVAPLIVASWQLYRLGVSGQTPAKRWFGVQVTTAEGDPPGLRRALVRESFGRWGLSGGIAFTVWRYIGAYPDLSVLTGLLGLLLLFDGLSGNLHRRRRTLHDRIAGTLVVDTTKIDRSLTATFPPSPPRWLIEKHGSTGTLVHSSSTGAFPLGTRLIWDWMRRHSRITLTILFAVSTIVVAGAFVAAQIYSQTQDNRLIAEYQKNKVFIALTERITATANGTIAERLSAILALGSTKDDPRVVRLLVDLLAQEKEPKAIETIQQVLVTIGLDALPELQRSNQTLAKDLDSLQLSNTQQQSEAISSKSSVAPENENALTDEEISKNPYALARLRLHATQEAIANILILNNNPSRVKDLSRTTLGQTFGSAPFALVLDKIDLSGINFRETILTGASFQGSRFIGAGEDNRLGTFDDALADLSGAELKQANLTGAILNHISMQNASLILATLNQADLFQANLKGANLSSAKLIAASLQQAVLENASLTGADLTEANLSQANLYGASLTRVSAVGTQLQLANLTQSDWRDADLSGANLTRAVLKNANLSSTRLKGTNFSSAQLQNVNLRNADLSMADFRGANLEGADFQGAIFVASNQPTGQDQFIQTPNIATGPRLKGVNFNKSKNLDAEQLAYICAQGGRHDRCP